MKGALQGFAINLFSPAFGALFLLLGGAHSGAWFVLGLPSLATLAAVLWSARGGRYPWWMITPDDLPRKGAPHFGHYEATVRKVYERFGRYWGDVYWLAFRNSNYGLAYYFKPEQFKGLTSYALLPRSVVRKSWGWKYKVAGYELLQVRLPLGFELLLGWQVRGAVLDPFGPRSPVNMEFRPMFSLRRAG